MDNEKQEIRKWIKIISFALIGYLIVQNVEIVGNILSKIITIISPFV